MFLCLSNTLTDTERGKKIILFRQFELSELLRHPFWNHMCMLSSRGAALYSLISLQLDGLVERLRAHQLLAQKWMFQATNSYICNCSEKQVFLNRSKACAISLYEQDVPCNRELFVFPVAFKIFASFWLWASVFWTNAFVLRLTQSSRFL